MDYDSPERVKACQLPGREDPPSCAAWKGMGSCGAHRPQGFHTRIFRFILLFVGLSMSAEALLSGPEGCELNRCSETYMTVKDDNNTCAALRTYYRCIMGVKGCQADPLPFVTLRQILRTQLKKNDCNTTGQTLTIQEPPRLPQIPAVCQFKGRPVYRHCALFGDPHLRTFNDEVQTCRVKGARPLVNNDYLTVQVTNDLVFGSTEATAISKLTVIVKGHPECTSKDFQTYQAQSGDLPDTFDDGRTTVGSYRSLEIEELEPDAHVRIHIRYINTEIDIRQIGRYFTFSIKMPEELINRTSGSSIPGARPSARHAIDSGSSSDLDLCVRGCPLSEQIDYGVYLARYKTSAQADEARVGERPVVSRDYAQNVCKEAQLVDFYFDSCVFDLMTTGDENFTLSAKKALQDMVRLDPSVVRTMVNRTSLSVYDQRHTHREVLEPGHHNGASGSGLGVGWRTHSEQRATCVLVLCLTFLAHVWRWSVR